MLISAGKYKLLIIYGIYSILYYIDNGVSPRTTSVCVFFSGPPWSLNVVGFEFENIVPLTR